MKEGLFIMAVVCVSLCAPQRSFAVSPDRVDEITGKLVRQLELFAKARLDVEREDLGRYARLQKVSQKVWELLQDPNKGALHSETHRAMRKFAIVYSRAETFLLKQIASDRTFGHLSAIVSIAKEIAKDLSIDEPVYTYNTLAIADELKNQIDQLLKHNLRKEFRDKILRIVPEIARLSGKSALGDQFKTFKAAIPLCHRIRTLYSDFYALPATHPAYETCLDIQGINEEYIEFARIEDEVTKEKE